MYIEITQPTLCPKLKSNNTYILENCLDDAGASVKGGQLPPHSLANHLTLFKPGGHIMPLTLQLAPPLQKAIDAPASTFPTGMPEILLLSAKFQPHKLKTHQINTFQVRIFRRQQNVS